MSPEYVVRTMMRALGNSRRMPTIASMPFKAGIWRSINVTSGRCDRNCSIASHPFEASATNFMSDSALINAAIPSRRRGWSSTVRMRIGFLSLLTSSLLLAEQLEFRITVGFSVSNRRRNGQLDFRARSGFAPEIQSCSDQFCALPDSGQPPVSGTRALLENLSVDALAVVADSQAKQMIVITDLSLNAPCPCVPKRVA